MQRNLFEKSSGSEFEITSGVCKIVLKKSFQVLVAFALSFMGLGSNPCCGDALLTPYPLSVFLLRCLQLAV